MNTFPADMTTTYAIHIHLSMLKFRVSRLGDQTLSGLWSPKDRHAKFVRFKMGRSVCVA